MQITPQLVVFALLAALPAALLFLHGMRSRRRAAALAEIRAAWGRPRERKRDLDAIARYHHMRVEEEGGASVDEGTWADLGADDVFAWMDRTESAVGQQHLYHLLRSPGRAPEVLAEMDAHARRLAEDAALRERVQGSIRGVGLGDALYLRNLFLGPLPARPAAAFVFPLLTLAAVAALGLAVLSPGAGLLAVLAISIANTAIGHLYRGRVHGLVRPMRVLHALGVAGGELAAIGDPVLARPVEELRRHAPWLRKMNRVSRWLVFESHGDDLAGMVYAYANMLFLLDVNAFVFSVEALRRRRAGIARVFEAVGHLDAACAVAGVRAGLPAWCVPERLPAGEKALEARGLFHPLLEEPVANDLRAEGTGVLVTGSNMSGKTTFMRAVAINALLAGTVATCAAERWRAPALAVRTSIGREDSLLEGKSFFFAEAEAIGALLRSAEGGEQHLFAIDEIFRGTNTTERIAAATAVLEHLNRGPHLVLCSTHDLELLDLLGEGWEFHHFRETVEGGELRFDYRLRPGASSTRNAIRLLELTGYPPEVVRAADRTAEALLRAREAAPLPRG